MSKERKIDDTELSGISGAGEPIGHLEGGGAEDTNPGTPPEVGTEPPGHGLGDDITGEGSTGGAGNVG